MLYGALLSAISVFLWIVVLFTDNFSIIIPASFLLLFMALAWLGAAAADATEIAGVNLRGLAIAVYFFTVNIFAYIIGSNLIGFLSDQLDATANPLMMRYALLVCPISCVLAAVFLFFGSRILNRQES